MDYTKLYDITNIEIMRTLIAAGADINVRDSRMLTPLLHAIESGDNEIITLLINSGVDLNVHTVNSLTPLMKCISKENTEMVKLFLQAGVDINAVDIFGHNALTYSSRYNSTEIAELLLNAGIQTDDRDIGSLTSLMNACKFGALDIARLIIKKGVDINTIDNSGETALHHSIRRNDFEMIKLLIEEGIDVNLYYRDPCLKNLFYANDRCKSPLLNACYRGQLETVKILVQHNADTTVTDEYGKNCFALILEYPFLSYDTSRIVYDYKLGEVVKVMLEKNVKLINKYGDTPLLCAARYCITGIVNMLLNETTVYDSNNEDETILTYAYLNCDKPLAMKLIGMYNTDSRYKKFVNSSHIHQHTYNKLVARILLR